jgi:hypothetical protein
MYTRTIMAQKYTMINGNVYLLEETCTSLQLGATVAAILIFGGVVGE